MLKQMEEKKLGTWIISRKELYEKLEKFLDDIEGKILSDDFKDIAIELYDNYKHFADKKLDNSEHH